MAVFGLGARTVMVPWVKMMASIEVVLYKLAQQRIGQHLLIQQALILATELFLRLSKMVLYMLVVKTLVVN